MPCTVHRLTPRPDLPASSQSTSPTDRLRGRRGGHTGSVSTVAHVLARHRPHSEVVASLPAPGPERRRRRWPVVVLAVVALVVAVPLVAGGIFVWTFSGGWDGIRSKAQPTDPKVVSAREVSAGPANSVHTDTVDAVLDASGGTVLAGAETDTCREGQNSWKIHDGYTLRCTRTAATAIQLPEHTPVEGAARAVEDALLDQGWQSSRDPHVRSDGSGAATESVAYFHGSTLDSSVEVGVSALGHTPIYLPDPRRADWSDGSDAGVDVGAAFDAGTGVRLLVVIEVTYFED